MHRPTPRALACALALSAAFVAAPLARAQAPAAPTAPPPAVPDSVANQPGPWATDWTLGLSMTQSSFSTNWSGGDQGAIAWSARSEFTAERQMSTKFNWKHHLGLAYGQTSRQSPDPNDPNRRRWEQAEKTTDLITFETVGRWTLSGWADPYASLRMDTQFRDESNPLGSVSFSPIKLKETAGLAKVLEKTEKSEIITRLGFGARQTLGTTILSGEPRLTESFTSNDGGFEWYTNVKKPLAGGRIEYKGDLLVFAPVFYSGSDALDAYDAAKTLADPTHTEVAGYWRTPDVNWRNSFTSKITKVITVDLFVQLVYDKFDTAANVEVADPAIQETEIQRNIRLAGQFKETLGLGVSWTVF